MPSSTKFGKAGVPGASYSPPGTCREKRSDLVADIPCLAPVMVERDHTFVVPIEAFLSESMRRDVMSGTRIVFALRIKDDINHRNMSSASRNRTCIPGANENVS